MKLTCILHLADILQDKDKREKMYYTYYITACKSYRTKHLWNRVKTELAMFLSQSFSPFLPTSLVDYS